MDKKIISDHPKKILPPEKHPEITPPGKQPEVLPPIDPEDPFAPEEEPYLVPEEEPFGTPPFEIPPPGEGP